jgi:hypothetical protein
MNPEGTQLPPRVPPGYFDLRHSITCISVTPIDLQPLLD